MRSPRYGLLAAAAVLTLATTGCSDPTGTSSLDLSGHRARWAARGLTKYAYDYKVTGFFIGYAGHDIHLVVLNGAVQSAMDLTTGQSAPGTPSSWPTIDALFDQAARAESAGSLRNARFDPTFDYPAELDLAGLPDASGSVFASRLQLLP
jgi:hypothetical protein